ncbi:MAG TPA: acetoacetate decarboxylase family protein [Coleofasciculaceae cyanobacterium]
MAYPQAPWTLQGHAIQTVQLIDIERVRPLIPSELQIISVWPGKTLGGVYLSYYGSASVLKYSELIVVAGVVSYSGKIGGWVSHIYVDNIDSVAGGRDIWGLPKELAEFTWDKKICTASGYENFVLVRQGERTLCRLHYSPKNLGLQVPFSGDVFSTKRASILVFKGELKSRVSLVSSRLEIPSESHFANIGLQQPWLTVFCDELNLVAGAPQIVGHRDVEISSIRNSDITIEREI